MSDKANRALIIIGGREDKKGAKTILREVARRIGGGKLVVTTVASSSPAGMFEEYDRLFRGLGVRHIHKLEIATRAEATDEAKVRILDDATAVFFTGGSQLKITSQIGDTPIYQRLRDIYENGGTIIGTSAGASVMSATMLVSGNGEESHRIKTSLMMAPGFGFVDGIVIDQHFAERGRMGRLIGAVAQNPKNLGIGIDEDTAIVLSRARFKVIGSGAVYVLDGSSVTYSNLIEEEPERTMSIFDLKLHVLSQGDTFDLNRRVPYNHPAEEVGKEVGGNGQHHDGE